MPLQIKFGDITKQDVDAIVNAANNSLLGGGGVDGAIHRAAGPELLAECRTLGGCPTGEAKITGGYRLKARHVIHTVGPVWQGGWKGEELLLRSAYRRSLELARDNGLESVAFPLISSGIYGYPKAEVLKVAISEITNFLEETDLAVDLIIYDRESFQLSPDLVEDISSYLEDQFEDQLAEAAQIVEHPEDAARKLRRRSLQERNLEDPVSLLTLDRVEQSRPLERPNGQREHYEVPRRKAETLEDYLNRPWESFSERLLRLIDDRGISDVLAYKRANLDRKLFSKIRSNPNYQPSKATVLAFAISLKLSLEETRELLRTAGYALSPASRSDLIVEYFIRSGIYDIHEINQALFYFGQALLGA
ncbi:O-acetyl-ADP-ribose deacetylase [anaerobic digester metagenome]